MNQWTPLLIALLLVYGFVTAEIMTLEYFKHAHGDDTEDDLGLCYRGYKDHCQNNLQRDLEMKLFIWNLLNCSKRDICNPMNEDNDTDSGAQVEKQSDDIISCFNNPQDAKKWNGTYPCPEKKLTPNEELP